MITLILDTKNNKNAPVALATTQGTLKTIIIYEKRIIYN